MDSSFNESYTDYWLERVKKLSDGTKIADEDIADLFLPLLDIKKTDILLDMGCSYGRFFSLLSKYSDHLIGIDIEGGAIQKASEFAYQQLETGPLERMPFGTETFDRAFCWATFDCTEQETVLAETNRILKSGGLFLVTGKNLNYKTDDSIAFIAERNAKLKSFPNHFTDIEKLYNIAGKYGFSIEKGFAFQYRGDFGSAKALEITKTNIKNPFYEYLLVLRKNGNCTGNTIKICELYSNTAIEKANADGFSNPLDYFKYHQDKFGI